MGHAQASQSFRSYKKSSIHDKNEIWGQARSDPHDEIRAAFGLLYPNSAAFRNMVYFIPALSVGISHPFSSGPSGQSSTGTEEDVLLKILRLGYSLHCQLPDFIQNGVSYPLPPSLDQHRCVLLLGRNRS